MWEEELDSILEWLWNTSGGNQDWGDTKYQHWFLAIRSRICSQRVHYVMCTTHAVLRSKEDEQIETHDARSILTKENFQVFNSDIITNSLPKQIITPINRIIWQDQTIVFLCLVLANQNDQGDFQEVHTVRFYACFTRQKSVQAVESRNHKIQLFGFVPESEEHCQIIRIPNFAVRYVIMAIVSSRVFKPL